MDAVTGYHAHIYYRSPEERDAASALREQIEARFVAKLGRWRDAPVGPHAAPMFQVAFAPDQFAAIVPWLMLHRAGLVVFIHPETGRPRDDHLKHALWLGEILPLDGSVLPEEGE